MITESTSGADIDPAILQAICLDPGFRITTSMRWTDASNSGDRSHVDALVFHQARLLASADTFGFTRVAELLSGDTGRALLLDAIENNTHALPDRDSSWKLTMAVSKHVDIIVASTPLSGPLHDFIMPDPAFALPEAKVYLAPEPTAVSPFTSHKTNHRPMYATARAAAGIDNEGPTSAEVLLYNHKNEVMEASVSTIYFHRNGQWVTPASSCGGNLGSTRSLALDRGWCIEGIIMLQDIIDQESIVLSNGVRGFWLGRILGSL